MNSVLRPLRLGEILDQTAQLYRRNFLLFAGIAVIPTAIICVIGAAIGAAFAIPAIRTGASGARFPAAGGLFLLAMVVACPLMIVPAVFSQAGLTRAALNAVRGKKMKVREALGSVRPRFWRYLGLMILQGLIIAGIPACCAGLLVGAMTVIASRTGGAVAILSGLVIACIVIAAIVAVFMLLTEYAMGLAACVEEDKPAWDALQRSRRLSKGSRGRIFLMFLVVWLMLAVLAMIGYIPSIILVAVVAAMGHGSQHSVVAMIVIQVVNLLINFSLQTLVAPAYMIALALFYFDQRVRLEGYDIQWMMEQAGLSAPAVATDSNAAPGFSAADAGPAPAHDQ